MPHARTFPFARSSQLVFALVLTGCLDPAFSAQDTLDDASVLEASPGDGWENARRKPKKDSLSLYVEPNTNASEQADLWANSNPVGAARMEIIAAQQIGIWVGDWIADPQSYVDDAVTRAGAAIQTLVLYNMTNRDCGNWSAGGAADAAEYEQFVDDFAAGIGGRPVIVVVEPDSLPMIESCGFSDTEKQERYDLIAYAVDTLTAAGARVYVDAGDSAWIPAATMAARLEDAGVLGARGFSLNVSHTEYTDDEAAYAEEIRAILGTDMKYVVDTGRNGLGPAWDNEWCNPAGRALGAFPTFLTGVEGMDAKLWVKPPGESDGSCNGGPIAGAWWPEYAEDLAVMAGF